MIAAKPVRSAGWIVFSFGVVHWEYIWQIEGLSNKGVWILPVTEWFKYEP